MVARFQPLHYGHIRIVNYMLAYCKQITIIIGSTQESKTFKNPLSYNQRFEIVSNYFKKEVDKNIISISGQNDIGIENDDKWLDVILKTVKNIYTDDYIPVDAYFSGSEYDAKWYTKIKKIIILDRKANGFENISATRIRKLYCENNNKYLDYIPNIVVPYLGNIVCK